MRGTLHLALLWLCASAALNAGCDQDIVYVGYNVVDHFPLDGDPREWEYDSFDETIDWTLLVEKQGSIQQSGASVVSLELGNDDTADLYWEVQWSSDSSNGVRIHGFTDIYGGGDEVSFSPPIQFAEKQMVPEDVITTDSGGYTWTSTFQGVEGCETYWVPGWSGEECLVFELDDGDGLPETNGVIVGSYWLVPRYGPAWLDLDAYEGVWNLSGFDWE